MGITKTDVSLLDTDIMKNRNVENCLQTFFSTTIAGISFLPEGTISLLSVL